MSTDTPYSDAWRERTRERMAALGLDIAALSAATGCSEAWLRDELSEYDRADFELAGAVDDALARFEDAADAKSIRRGPRAMRVVGRGDVYPVACDLQALCDCDVVLHGGKP